MAECKACPEGEYADQPKSKECNKCDYGTAHDLTGQTHKSACIDCKVGYHANKEGMKKCEPCDPGEYADKEQMKECEICPAGGYCPGPIYDKFVPCDKGYASKNEKQTDQNSCKKCDPGTYADEKKTTECEDCPKGHYCPASSSSLYDQKKECDAGKANTKTGQTQESACIPCRPGYFQNGDTPEQCQKCPVGKYSQNQGMMFLFYQSCLFF